MLKLVTDSTATELVLFDVSIATGRQYQLADPIMREACKALAAAEIPFRRHSEKDREIGRNRVCVLEMPDTEEARQQVLMMSERITFIAPARIS